MQARKSLITNLFSFLIKKEKRTENKQKKEGGFRNETPKEKKQNDTRQYMPVLDETEITLFI
ncbi:MAG: hypothetical protein V4504_01400 [Patescibacteria group bacterium]